MDETRRERKRILYIDSSNTHFNTMMSTFYLYLSMFKFPNTCDEKYILIKFLKYLIGSVNNQSCFARRVSPTRDRLNTDGWRMF